MFDLARGLRVLAAAALSAVVIAGCSSGGPSPEPVPPPPPPPPVAAPPVVVAPGETSEAAVTVAEASADPARGFVLASGDPARCLESQGGSRPDVGVVLDGRALLGDCRDAPGQIWSFEPVAPEPAPADPTPQDPQAPPAPGAAPQDPQAPPAPPAPGVAPPGPPPGTTYRMINRAQNAELCFEGAPAVARDGAANTPCGDLTGQSWDLVPTAAGFYRLRTTTPEDTCLGVAPVAPGAPGTPDAAPAVPGVAMVPCEPPDVPPGAPRSTQDWELLAVPELPVAPPPPPPAPAAPSPGPAPEAPAAPSGPVGEVLAQVNAERARAGCAPVSRDARLDRAAERHAQWMDSSSGNFSHTGEGGSSPRDRARAQGWSAGSGENIARGQTSASEVMDDWMGSPGHRRNILDCEWSSIGLARTGSSGSPTWVQTFGG